MNYSMIRYMLGLVSCFSAMFMTLPMLVSVIYKEKSGFSFLAVALFSLAVGILTARKKPQNRKMYARWKSSRRNLKHPEIWRCVWNDEGIYMYHLPQWV